MGLKGIVLIVLVVVSHHWPIGLSVVHDNSWSNHSKGKGEKHQEHSYLRIKLVQCVYGVFYTPSMDSMLNVSPDCYSRVLLLWLKVRLFGKLGSRFRVPFHRQVVQDEGIDVAGHMF